MMGELKPFGPPGKCPKCDYHPAFDKAKREFGIKYRESKFRASEFPKLHNLAQLLQFPQDWHSVEVPKICCRKIGKWVSGILLDALGEEGGHPEHLEVLCPDCGYIILMQCADAKEQSDDG